MSAWFVGGWAGWYGWAVGWVVFVVCGFGVGGFATCWNWFFYEYMVVGILLIYFLCNIVQYVICACLSGLEESHPSGDSDLLLLALPG